MPRHSNSGSFQVGHKRKSDKVCDQCGANFKGGPNQKRCYECLHGRRCELCGEPTKTFYHRFCSLRCAGIWRRDNEPSDVRTERCAAISRALKGRPKARGEQNPRWKGGKIDRRAQMERFEYKAWRTAVIKRDGGTCVLCSAKRSLSVHHIHRWIEHPELRYEPQNGVTLCKRCHESTYGREESFAPRFDLYVTTKETIHLTESEMQSLLPHLAPCNWCGATVRRKRSEGMKNRSFFCNSVCKAHFAASIGYNWYLASDHPPAEVLPCKQCGKEVRRVPSKRRAYAFCSLACLALFESTRHSENRVIVTCPQCGTEIRIKPSRVGRTKFCSRQCAVRGRAKK